MSGTVYDSRILHNKGNQLCQICKTGALMSIYPLHHGVSFYPLLLSFHLEITGKKVRNLQIGDTFVGKVSINLLHHAKSAILVQLIEFKDTHKHNTKIIGWQNVMKYYDGGELEGSHGDFKEKSALVQCNTLFSSIIASLSLMQNKLDKQ